MTKLIKMIKLLMAKVFWANEERNIDDVFRAGLKQFADIENVSTFSVLEEELEFNKYGSTERSQTSFTSSDRGVHVLMGNDFSYIYIDYGFEFTVKGERYSIKHHIELQDWETIPNLYEDYFFEKGDRTLHKAYKNFWAASLWAAFRIMEKFDSEFNQKEGFIFTIGEKNLGELKEYLTFVVGIDYYE